MPNTDESKRIRARAIAQILRMPPEPLIWSGDRTRVMRWAYLGGCRMRRWPMASGHWIRENYPVHSVERVRVSHMTAIRGGSRFAWFWGIWNHLTQVWL